MNKVHFNIDWANANLAAYQGTKDRSFESKFDWGTNYPYYNEGKFAGICSAEAGGHENVLLLGHITSRIYSLKTEIVNDSYAVAL